MHESPIVFSSDSINRYGMRFTAGALASCLRDQGEIGNPLLLSHDATRPIGWSQVTAVHFEPGLTRLAGQMLIPETAEDRDHLRFLKQAHSGRLADERAEEVAELLHLLSLHLDGTERLSLRGCVALVAPGLAERVLPEVFAERDSDGLLSLRLLKPIGPGVYRFGDIVLFAHSFLRRSLSRSNSLDAPLLRQLQHLASGDLNARIALDQDMVGLARSNREYFELDYWWGPKFDDDLATIPIGVTCHAASEYECFYHGISRTEFWWYVQDNRITFEVEELRDLPWAHGEVTSYGCRFAHAMVDEETGRVGHFDGAIRMYPEELMVERLDSVIDDFGRRDQYTKVLSGK